MSNVRQETEWKENKHIFFEDKEGVHLTNVTTEVLELTVLREAQNVGYRQVAAKVARTSMCLVMSRMSRMSQRS